MINKWKYIAAAVLGLALTLQYQVASANNSPRFISSLVPGNQENTEGDQVSIELYFTDKDATDTLTITATDLLPGLNATISGPEIYPRTNWWTVTISGTLASNSATSLPEDNSITVSDGTDSASGSVLWQVINGNPNPLDDNAAIVYLRTDCGTLENCFVNIGELGTWINTVRTPTQNTPLLVEIGPGTFSRSTAPQFTCKTGNVTFRGAGQGNTVIGLASIPSTVFLGPGFFVNGGHNCSNLVVEDLTLIGPGYGVRWEGSGSSIWRNVDSIGGAYGWSDINISCGSTPASSHFWHNSRLIGGGPSSTFAKGYFSACADNWFFGTEITAQGGSDGVIAISAAGNAKYHIYGSNLNAIAAPGASFSSPETGIIGILGVAARDDSEVHIHGTGIDVIGEPNGAYGIAGIRVADNARVHAPGTAYNLIPPIGQKMHRLLNVNGTAKISAPFQWHPATTPPSGLVTQEGADMFVESDCAVGGCTQAGSETHLLIYNSNCETVAPAGGPWFDVVTAKCRGE